MKERENIKIREKQNEMKEKNNGQTIEKIMQDTERDYFMSGSEAKNYGIIDEVIVRPPKGLQEAKTGQGAKESSSRHSGGDGGKER